MCVCVWGGGGGGGRGGGNILSVAVSLIREPVWPSGKALGW